MFKGIRGTGGQVHDSVPALELVEDLAADHAIADKAYEVEVIVAL